MKRGQAPWCVLHRTHVAGTVRKLVHMKRIEERKSEKSLNAPGILLQWDVFIGSYLFCCGDSFQERCTLGDTELWGHFVPAL